MCCYDLADWMKVVIILQSIPVLYASLNGLGKSVDLISPAVLIKVEMVGRQIRDVCALQS